uniref:RNA-directed DNA polymerase, eukaryota, reverse transcriptase zinc-binding domain protein n=1 Tax=Tanacetum cinerariifolium TaxID=118510 RepID=A0A699IUA2_TANCI|nr:RNA-directed DNA polymerase, eukaryota, reverse transcriptase zinc-binding domain protein [Tanacetum cinerariifolium]
MTWVRWNKCLASKDLGGLGIESIFRLNIGLLFKWIWRFLHCPSDLWMTVIKNIYGSHGGINDTSTLRFSHSTWGGILSFIKRIKQKCNDLFSYCVRKIGDGASTRFWEDTWCGDQPLKTLFPRIYLLEPDKHCFVKYRFPFQDLSSALRRHPRSGAEMAQFSGLQAKIATVVLSDQDVETINHIFFSSDMSFELWVKLARWWGLDIPVCANILEWFEWIDSLHSSNIVKTTLEGVG